MGLIIFLLLLFLIPGFFAAFISCTFHLMAFLFKVSFQFWQITFFIIFILLLASLF